LGTRYMAARRLRWKLTVIFCTPQNWRSSCPVKNNRAFLKRRCRWSWRECWMN